MALSVPAGVGVVGNDGVSKINAAKHVHMGHDKVQKVVEIKGCCLGPSPTTDLDPNLVTSHINPSKSNPHPLTSKVGALEVQRRKREVTE